jgi:hypothetical protein
VGGGWGEDLGGLGGEGGREKGREREGGKGDQS